MLSPRSRNTKLEISSPLPISTSPARSPTLVAAPLSPARSIATEITGPQGKSIDQKPDSLSDNRGTNRTLDLFDKDASDEENIIDEEAVGSVSDFSDHPTGSNVGIKSPNRSSWAGKLEIPLTTRPPSRFLGGEPRSRESSKSSEGSITVWEAHGRRKGSEISRQEDGIPGSPIADSPTLGRDFSASTKGMKSPAMDSQGKHLSISTRGTKSPKSPKSPRYLTPRSPKSPKSPNPTVDSIGTSSTTSRAEKGLLSPFLPKFLKVLGTPEAKEEPDGKKSPQSPLTAPEPHLRSIFDGESGSDDDNAGEATEIGLAKQASIHRPTPLHQSSTNTVVGLQEMLRSTGPPSSIPPLPPSPTSARLTPAGLSAAKAAQILGPEFNVLNGILDTPPVVAAHSNASRTRAGTNLGEPENRKVSHTRAAGGVFDDGLRSHPPPSDPFVHRSATVPSRRPLPATATASATATAAVSAAAPPRQAPTEPVRATPGIPGAPPAPASPTTASASTVPIPIPIPLRNKDEKKNKNEHEHSEIQAVVRRLERDTRSLSASTGQLEERLPYMTTLVHQALSMTQRLMIRSGGFPPTPTLPTPASASSVSIPIPIPLRNENKNETEHPEIQTAVGRLERETRILRARIEQLEGRLPYVTKLAQDALSMAQRLSIRSGEIEKMITLAQDVQSMSRRLVIRTREMVSASASASAAPNPISFRNENKNETENSEIQAAVGRLERETRIQHIRLEELHEKFSYVTEVAQDASQRAQMEFLRSMKECGIMRRWRRHRRSVRALRQMAREAREQFEEDMRRAGLS